MFKDVYSCKDVSYCNNVNTFSGMYQNVRGLRTKLNLLRTNVPCLNYDFFALTETWLCDSIHDNELNFKNYNIFRYDRDHHSSKYKRGGGVALCILKKFPAIRLNTPILCLEHLIVEVKLNHKSKIVLVVCYIPPSSLLSSYVSFINSLEWLQSTLPTNHKILIMGDFNLPLVTFSSDNNGLHINGGTSERSDVLFDFFSENGFLQYNLIKNHVNSQLDLIFSNITNTIVSGCHEELVPIDVYHPVLTISCEYETTPVSHRDKSYKYNFKRADFNLIIKVLFNCDWSNVYNSHCIDFATNEFYRILSDVIYNYVPKYTFSKQIHPNWFSPDLRRTLNKKLAAHRKYKASKLHSDYVIFSNFRKQCKQLINKCNSDHIINTQKNLISNPKYFWNYVNMSRNNSDIPVSVHLSGKTFNNHSEAANAFSDWFASVYEKPISFNDSTLSNIIDCVNVSMLDISVSEVFDSLTLLNCASSSGPDSIPPILLHNCR